ncbi:hypothetical protein ABKW28_14650 [Nocardioides sp. 31GB23]|uniref:hypothetical protein n=1 Tax=Nocardioides sp. 31GB23 TaxID=3156065 RepID=UPI0032AF15DD
MAADDSDEQQTRDANVDDENVTTTAEQAPGDRSESSPDDGADDGGDAEGGEAVGDASAEEVEESTTSYERLPGGGHRVIRRTVRRRVSTSVEDVDEYTIEDLPPDAYRAPATQSHPRPVG